jgi:ferrous-iron efflux pump FieF
MGHHHHHTLTKQAILLPMILSVFLVGIKAYGWQETDSVSLLSSLLDSAMDILISSLNLAAVIYAAKPADDDHRYGHNSIEDLVGLVQASFIAASAIFLLYEAGYRFVVPGAVQNPETGIGVLVISIIAPLVIVIYQKIILRKTRSVVLEADSLHYLTDLLMNALIIVSIYTAAKPDLGWVDPLLATAIAFYILYSAYQIGQRSFNHLMDKQVKEEDFLAIQSIIKAHEGIVGYHDLKTRAAGSKIFIQLHVELEDHLNVKQAHDIVESLEQKLEGEFEHASVIIHMDPVSIVKKAR